MKKGIVAVSDYLAVGDALFVYAKTHLTSDIVVKGGHK